MAQPHHSFSESEEGISLVFSPEDEADNSSSSIVVGINLFLFLVWVPLLSCP
jgi:hypothetical protein